MSEFKVRFRELRKNLSITLREMSEDLGIPLSSISKYEQGIIKPGVEILARVANCYKVNLNWLVANQGLMFESGDFDPVEGSDEGIRVRLVKYSNTVKIHPLSNAFIGRNADIKVVSPEDVDDTIKQLSRTVNRPITVEFSNTEMDDKVKVFYPEGNEKILNKDEDSMRNDLLKKVRSKLDILPYDTNKLEFLDTAIDSLESKGAFDQLKTLVKGMDIAMN